VKGTGWEYTCPRENGEWSNEYSPPLVGGVRGIRVKLRNSWDGRDYRDVLTGHLYARPCLLVIHKSTKVTGDVAIHCPPLAGD